MSRVAINKEVLNWAVHRCGMEIDELEQKFPKIHEWVSGEIKPTLKQLELLAKATLTPLGFFFLTTPPELRLPIPLFRTIRDETLAIPSTDLFETIQIMQRRQAWMREFILEQGQNELPFVGSVRHDEQPNLVVTKILKSLNLNVGWATAEQTWTDALHTLRQAIENAGILVVVNGIIGNNTHRKLDPNEFRGFVLVDNYAPLVFVNGSDGKAAQMFTLAHELAHVFFGSSAAFDLREMQPADDPVERACNRVAAEFLVPQRELRQIWSSVKEDSDPFQTIAGKFKVSSLVAARRVLDINLINREVFLNFYRAYQNDERRIADNRSAGGDFYANQNLRIGQRFASTVIRAVKEGKLLYSEAYRLTDLYGKTFDYYASSLGFGGA
ncbi:MAG: ImmA/IrrE family metallo-endopeptidase [Sedimentisphaerales bacterium]|nr:ImmA/IrrE family metallo-endopeptidase [Sedimentisphaerales bacterium]